MPPKSNKESPTDKYRYCNHHHEIGVRHQLMEINGQEIVANNEAVALLTALNSVGLVTRTHHVSDDCDHAFVSILLDNVRLEIVPVQENSADRTMYNGKTELLILWDREN